VAEKLAPLVHPRLSCSTVAVKRSLAEQMAEMSDEELSASIKEIGVEDELATGRPKRNA